MKLNPIARTRLEKAALALLDRSSYDVDVATDHLGGVTVPAHVRLTPEAAP